MITTRLIEGFLGSDATRAEGKRTSAMATCARLLVQMHKASTPDKRLVVIEQLVELSAEHPFLPLGAQAVTSIIGLAKRARDEENDTKRKHHAIRLCVQLLQTVIKAPPKDSGEKEAKIVVDNTNAVAREGLEFFISAVAEPDTYIQLYTVQILTSILVSSHKDRTQRVVLSVPRAVNNIVALLDNANDMIRNEAVLLLASLIRGNPHIQKIVAFDGVFEKVFSIARQEGYLMGGMLVIDVLGLVATLLRNNTSNQNLFVETGCTKLILPFLQVSRSEDMTQRKLDILEHAFEVLECLLPPGHRMVSGVTDICPALLAIASNNDGLPPRTRASALTLVGRLIDSKPRNQACLVSSSVKIIPAIKDLSLHLAQGGGVEAKSVVRPALCYLLSLALGSDEATPSGQVPREVVAASHFALRSFFRSNFGTQAALCQVLSTACSSGVGAAPAQSQLDAFVRLLLRGLTLPPDAHARAARDYRRLAGITDAESKTDGVAEKLKKNLGAPAALWVAQSVLLHAMRANPTAKAALVTPSRPGAKIVLERVIAELLSWRSDPTLTAAADSDIAADNPLCVSLPFAPFTGQLLILCELLDGQTDAVRCLAGGRGGFEALDFLVAVAKPGGESKNHSADNNSADINSVEFGESGVIVRGLACFALIVCLRQVVAVSETQDDGGTRMLLQSLRTVIAEKLTVNVLKANLGGLRQSAAFLRAKTAVADAPEAQASGRDGVLSVTSLDREFCEDFEKLYANLDSLLLTLFTATAPTPPPFTPSKLTAGPSDGKAKQDFEKLVSAYRAAEQKAQQATVRSEALATQLKRAVKAIKILESRLRTAKQQQQLQQRSQQQTRAAEASGPASSAEVAALRARLSDFAGKFQEQDDKSSALQGRVAELEGQLRAEEEKGSILQEKLVKLTEEHEDLLVLLASEELDKEQLVRTLEAATGRDSTGRDSRPRDAEMKTKNIPLSDGVRAISSMIPPGKDGAVTAMSGPEDVSQKAGPVAWTHSAADRSRTGRVLPRRESMVVEGMEGGMERGTPYGGVIDQLP